MNKTMRLFPLVLLLLSGIRALPAQNIQFETGTWENVQEKAQATDRLIFLDIYTKWCKPCRWMEDNVFTDSAVARYMNRYFINYRVDAEEGVGKLLGRKYRVDRYPTMLFLEASTKEIYNIVGFVDAPAFLEEVKRVSDPVTLNRLRVYHRKFQSGVRDKRFMTQYLTLLSSQYKKTNPQVFNAWFKTLRLPDYLDTSTMKLLLLTIPDAQTRAYGVALDLYEPHRFRTTSTLGDSVLLEQMHLRMHRALDTTIEMTLRDGDQSKFERAFEYKEKLILKEQDSLPHDFQLSRQQKSLAFYLANQKEGPFIDLADNIIQSHILPEYSSREEADTVRHTTRRVFKFDFAIDTSLFTHQQAAEMLHIAANGLLQLSSDTVQLLKAIAWEHAALSLHRDIQYYSTLAHLQLKSGNPEEATSTLRGAYQKYKKSDDQRAFLKKALMDLYQLQRKEEN